MYHPKTREWDRKLKRICDRLDAWLEDQYGDRFRLRPNRARRGETSNPEMDGLFNIQAVFTPGYGTEHGRGYYIEIEMSTMDNVDSRLRTEIRDQVKERLEKELKEEFPERKLDIGFEENMIKIWGELSLGSL